MGLSLIRKVQRKYLQVIHSESKPQSSIQTKMKTDASVACDVQLVSKTFSIYGN